MAHNLNFANGKYSFVNAGTNAPAWHGLGTHFSERLLTTKEAIEMAGLNYRVEKAPLYAGIGDEGVLVKNLFTTYRTDTNDIFGGAVTDIYKVLQNTEAFDFFDDVLKNDNGYSISTAGALGSGERIFITAKVDKQIIVGKDDLIEQYLLLTHSHDGKNSIVVALTPIRVVCNNTLTAALSEKNNPNKISIRHTENAKDRMRTAAEIFGLVASQTKQMSELYNHLANEKFSDKRLHQFVIDVMLPPSYSGDRQIGSQEFSTRFGNIVDSVMEYALGNPTQQTETTRGTKFGAYNAITGYYQNVYNHKNSESKFDSIFGGTAEKASQKALQILLTN